MREQLRSLGCVGACACGCRVSAQGAKTHLAQKELRENAAKGPGVNGGGVIRGAKDELRRPVVPRADIRDVGLS